MWWLGWWFERVCVRTVQRLKGRYSEAKGAGATSASSLQPTDWLHGRRRRGGERRRHRLRLRGKGEEEEEEVVVVSESDTSGVVASPRRGGLAWEAGLPPSLSFFPPMSCSAGGGESRPRVHGSLCCCCKLCCCCCCPLVADARRTTPFCSTTHLRSACYAAHTSTSGQGKEENTLRRIGE